MERAYNRSTSSAQLKSKIPASAKSISHPHSPLVLYTRSTLKLSLKSARPPLAQPLSRRPHRSLQQGSKSTTCPTLDTDERQFFTLFFCISFFSSLKKLCREVDGRSTMRKWRPSVAELALTRPKCFSNGMRLCGCQLQVCYRIAYTSMYAFVCPFFFIYFKESFQLTLFFRVRSTSDSRAKIFLWNWSNIYMKRFD